MRPHFGIIGAACLILAAPAPLGAQAPSGSGSMRIAAVQSPDFQKSAETRAAASVAGKFRFKIKIRVKSGSPETTLPTCAASITHSGTNRTYFLSGGKQGTRNNNLGLCDFVVFYLWTGANTGAPVSIQLTIQVGTRRHSLTQPAIALPPNGATTLIQLEVTA
jgi:hypothetical protein